jgi:metallopeptidase YgjP-like protein
MGSCNRESGYIWVNLELAKKDPHCLEYVVVHEMAHLLERNHGERFTKLMDSLLPNCRSRRDALNTAPLADEIWTLRISPIVGRGPTSAFHELCNYVCSGSGLGACQGCGYFSRRCLRRATTVSKPLRFSMSITSRPARITTG